MFNLFKRKYYKKEVLCSNCNEFVTIKIPKGTKFKDYPTQCKECGHKGKVFSAKCRGGYYLTYI